MEGHEIRRAGRGIGGEVDDRGRCRELEAALDEAGREGARLAGGVLGAGIALLYAPKAGRRLRMDIKNKAGDIIDQGEEYITSVRDRASEIAKDARRGITGLFSNSTEREVSRSVKSAGGVSVRTESHKK